MSDTDDTDALLIIPPDSFIVNFESDSDITICEKPACVVDVMMNHVEDLRYKLTQLNTQLGKEQSNTYPHSINTHKFRSSTNDTTCCKPNVERNQQKLCERTSKSQNQNSYSSIFSDISSISTFPSGNHTDDHLLNEIDNFLTKTVAGFEQQKFTRVPPLCLRNIGSENNECSDNGTKFGSSNTEKSLQINSYEGYALKPQQSNFKDDVSNACMKTVQDTQNKLLMTGEENSKQVSSDEGSLNKNDLSKDFNLDKLWDFEHRDMEHETEKLRREHCEREIQILQTKLSESQEKLAIAAKVDKAKDLAINQLKLAWQRLANNYENKDIQLNVLMSSLQKERLQLEADKQNYIKSCETHKAEINNSYGLVKSLQERISILEKTEHDLNMKSKHQEDAFQCQLRNQELLYNGLMKEKNGLIEQNQELSRTIDTLRNEVENECKKFIAEETKLKTLAVQYSNKESELNIVQAEKTELKIKVSQEQEKNNRLEILKRNLNTALDESKIREGKLLSEMKIIKKQMEAQKKDLKLFYQNQVEMVVKEKMQEFQTQLEFAEKCMESEIRKKEQALTEKLSKQMQNLVQQNELEINLLKEKHGEEIELYKLQLKNAIQQNSALKEKLANYYEKRGKIAEQLHKVMENQWQAALQIISSPSVSDKNGDSDFNKIKILPAHNISVDDFKVLNESEICNEKPETDQCAKVSKKNSLVVISTPVSSRFVPNENDLESYIKQCLLHASESKQSLSDWQKLPHGVPKLKTFSEEEVDMNKETENFYFKNIK